MNDNDIIEKLESIPETATKFKVTGLAYLALLLPYRCKIIYPGGELAKVGRASFQCLNSVLTFGKTDDDYVIEIGDFCQSAGSGHIIAGGEHKNEKPINHPLAMVSGMESNRKSEITTKGKIIIGNNVTLSRNVTILSGLTVGDGAILGAGSVITKDIPPFTIAAGNPAKVLRPRFLSGLDERYVKDIRWWDMDLQSIETHYNLIQGFQSINKNTITYQTSEEKECYFILSCTPNYGKPDFHFEGIQIAGKNIKYKDLPAEFKFYIRQMTAKPGDDIYILRNIFRFCGFIS